jgi:DNA-directed RNA polymerase specialized sigma24 family protein
VEDRPPQEAELIARAKGGELDAYEEIVRRHQTIAFRTAWVITRSAADAEEAAQDAFVKAHAGLPRFREGSPFRPWLLAIVANEARNRVRGAGRHVRIAQRVVEERRPDDAVPSPSSLVTFSRWIAGEASDAWAVRLPPASAAGTHPLARR